MKDPTDQEISTARLAVNDDEKIRESYEPLRVLGQGGMGRVILARHRFLGHLVAIKKLIIPETGPDSRSCSRFLNEAKAAKRLKHPNVVQLHEFGIDTQGSPYAVMDYIEGEPLSSLLQREETLSAVRAAALCKQVAEGLAHAHEQGVVHRDIKPSNIIVQRAGAEERAVIVDFGIAKLITAAEQELSKTGEILGSPLYFSPEQALGQQTGPGSDIYSLGCMIFECIHGTPPFVSDSAVQTAMMHVNAKTPIATDASGKAKTPIDQVIERCMQKAPEDRYANAAILASDLNAIQLGKTLTDTLLYTSKTRQEFNDRRIPDNFQTKDSSTRIALV
ncbi:MAG: serine/threonine protein kinase [Candidatus Obscuribacterales bacterium]|nr:serine/threonine protein kinase [Candidatus Obscuribacterales bacterium]